MIDSLKRSDNPFFVCSENRSDKLLHRRCVFLILSFSRGLNSNACHCQEMEDKFDMIGSFTVEILLSVGILSLLMPIGLSMWNQIMVCHAFLLALGKVHFLSKGPRLPYKLSNLWKILYMHLSLSLSLVTINLIWILILFLQIYASRTVHGTGLCHSGLKRKTSGG